MPSESPLRDRHGPGYALIETFRRAADGEFQRLERHLARLENSARTLGFRFSCAEAELELGKLNADGALRVRFELSHDGRLDLITTPFESLPENTVWRVAAASTRLEAADPLRRHKTTRRDVYAAARAEYAADRIDEVLLLNDIGVLAEGTITNIFADMGEGALATPPISSGALPGVLRSELIETGRALEKRLTLADLSSARAIFVGNSLRGLIRARLEQAP